MASVYKPSFMWLNYFLASNFQREEEEELVGNKGDKSLNKSLTYKRKQSPAGTSEFAYVWCFVFMWFITDILGASLNLV